MQSAFQQVQHAEFREVALGNVEKFRNYSAHNSFSTDPVTCAAHAPSGVLMVDVERYHGGRFIHWHKVEGGVALTDISLETDLDNNFTVVSFDKRSAIDEVWLCLSEPSVQEKSESYLLCMATSGGSFFQMPLSATRDSSLFANTTAHRSVRTEASEMPDVAMATFGQLEDNVSEIVWVSSYQAAVAGTDGYLYLVELCADSQWRLRRFVSKPSLWLVEALVPEAPGEVMLGLTSIALSEQLEKVLSVDEAGVVKLWDLHGRSLQSHFDLRPLIFADDDESEPRSTLQKALIRVFPRDHGKFVVVVAVTYPVSTTLSSSLVMFGGDVHTGELGVDVQFLEQDWEGWVPHDLVMPDRFTANVAWKCGRTKERLTSYQLSSEQQTTKHRTLFRDLDERLMHDAQHRGYSFIPEQLSTQTPSILRRLLLRRVLDDERFDWDVIQHVCAELAGREKQPARSRSQLAQLIVSSMESWDEEDWLQRANELDWNAEDAEVDEAEALHLKFSVFAYLCTERQKEVSSRVALAAVGASFAEDSQQLFDLAIVRGNRLSLLLPVSSTIELVDMEAEQFSFPALKPTVLELVALGEEFCNNVAADIFWLPFELGCKSQQLLDTIESHVGDIIRAVATRSGVVEKLRQAVQGLSVAELDVVFTKFVNMLSAEADSAVFVSLLPSETSSQSSEPRRAQFLLQGQVAAHLLASQTRALLQDRFTTALSVCCALSALGHLGARVVPSALGARLRSTYIPRVHCNLAAVSFVLWASETTCAPHAIHDTPLRPFEKDPAFVPNMLRVLMGGSDASPKMPVARSEMFERWHRSTNLLTAFWAFAGPAVQEFWGSHGVHSVELLAGRWAHVLDACITALRPGLDSELCAFLEMTAQYSVLSRLCSLLELKTSLLLREPTGHSSTDMTWLNVMESRVCVLASNCTLAEVVETFHVSARKASAFSEKVQHKLKQLAEDACENMLTGIERVALLDGKYSIIDFLVDEEVTPASILKTFMATDISLPVEAAYTLTRMVHETRNSPKFKVLKEQLLESDATLPESWAIVSFTQQLHILSLFDRSRIMLGSLGADLALKCAYQAIQACENLFPEAHERLDNLWSKAAQFALAIPDRLDEAYAAINCIREGQLQKESVRALVTHVCDQGLLHWLIALPYSESDIAATIESELRLLAARNDVEAVTRGDNVDYNDCLFAYLCAQRQFHKAARWMYELHLKVEHQHGGSSSESLEARAGVLDAQIRLLAKAISTLELVPPLERVLKVDRIASEATAFTATSRKRPLSHVDNVVDINVLRAQFVRVVAAREVLQTQFRITDTFSDGAVQLQALIESGRFGAAYSFAVSAGLDASIVVERLTYHCCQSMTEDDNSAAAFADVDASYGPRVAAQSRERCWDTLQDILARETAERNFCLHAVAVETLLAHTPAEQSVPEWLIASIAGRALDDKNSCSFEACNGNATKFLRLLIQYDRLDEACAFVLRILDATNASIFSDPKRGQVAWLPYNDIDTLIAACKNQLRTSNAKLSGTFKRFQDSLARHIDNSLRSEYSGQTMLR